MGLAGMLSISLAALVGYWSFVSPIDASVPGNSGRPLTETNCSSADGSILKTDIGKGFASLEEYPFSASGVKLSFYDIKGQGIPELRREIRLKGPKDSDGISRDAYVSWKIDWSWPKDQKIDYSKMEVKYKIDVMLPRWIMSADINLSTKRAWDRYYQNMIRHEGQHVLHVLENVDLIYERIQIAALEDSNLSWTAANKIANEVVKKIQTLDREYDRVTVHGELEGVVLQES